MIHLTQTAENTIIITNPAPSSLKPPSPHPIKNKKPSPDIFSWLEGPYDTARGETALWIAVITQAMMDALSRSRHPEHRYHKHAATEWLSGNSKDFILVCVLADMDPDYVRCKAKRALMSPVAWRAAPGEGKRYIERKLYRQRLKKMRAHKNPDPADDGDSPRSQVIVGPWNAHA